MDAFAKRAMRGRFVRLLALLCALMLTLTACILPPEDPEDTGRLTEPTDPPSTEFAEDTSIYIAYGRLSESEKDIYNTIYSAIAAGELEYRVKGAEGGVVAQVYRAVVADHPEFFWLGQGYSYQTVLSGIQTEVILTPYVMDGSISQMADAFSAAAGPVLRQAGALPTAYEQILYIHDYLVENTQYDSETSDRIAAGEGEHKVLEGASAYGCLVQGKAVCGGYAAAFQYLTQALGYQCGRVEGVAGGGSHEWNYILLEDEYYYFDVTWDDPIVTDGTDSFKSYAFFGITTEELTKTHSIDDGQDVPVCEGTKYDYYRYNGRYFDAYSYEAVAALFGAWDGETRTDMKFAAADACGQAVAELMDAGRIFDIDPRFADLDMISYSVASGGQVLTIFLA